MNKKRTAGRCFVDVFCGIAGNGHCSKRPLSLISRFIGWHRMRRTAPPDRGGFRSLSHRRKTLRAMGVVPFQILFDYDFEIAVIDDIMRRFEPGLISCQPEAGGVGWYENRQFLSFELRSNAFKRPSCERHAERVFSERTEENAIAKNTLLGEFLSLGFTNSDADRRPADSQFHTFVSYRRRGFAPVR